MLQNELRQLGYHVPREELERAVFGEGTLQAVLDFQRKHGLRPTGIVDARTARAINVAVEARRPIPARFRVHGQVRHEDETPLEGLTVRAFDTGPGRESRLGEEAITDAEGCYEITFAAAQVAEFGKRRPDLVARVFDPEGGLLAESDVSANAADEEVIDITVVPGAEPGSVEEPRVRTITLRLINTESEDPLNGYRVRAFDLDAGEEPVELGFGITNPDGLCRIAFAAAEPGEEHVDDAEERPLRLRLEIMDVRGEPAHETEIEAIPDAPEPVQLRLPVPAPPERPSVRIEKLREHLGEDADALLRRLADEKVSTVADVRRLGGVQRLENLPVPADHAALRTLEAHARLSVLGDDVQLNQSLIDNGFLDIQSIADTPKSVFVETMKEKLGNPQAPVVYEKAMAQSALLNNVLTVHRVAYANGSKLEHPKNLADVLKQYEKCVCRDCESAVSPLAYLADLLSYALKHVRIQRNGAWTATSLEDLEDAFHQPFGSLPATCEAMDQKVRQVRLCIEVLRRRLAAKNLPAAGRPAEALSKSEKKYRLAAYQSLLTRLGTSYEELRLVRKGDGAAREAVAGRLGIELTAAHPDQLEQLLLDPDTMTERDLEALFGLASTEPVRDPLSGGATLDDPQRQIIRWNLDGVEWNRNTDVNGMIHAVLAHADGGEYQIELYRDAARAAKIAAGRRSGPIGRVALSAANSSGLSGHIWIDYRADSRAIGLAVIPRLLSWRLASLRTGWGNQDWAQGAGSTNDRSIIDPDLTDWSYLRTDLSASPAAALWTNRKSTLFEIRQKLDDARVQAATDAKALDNAFATILDYIVADQQLALADDQTLTAAVLKKLKKEEDAGESIESELKQRRLAYGEFSRLNRIISLVQSHNALLASEWTETSDILIQVYKRWLFPVWRKIEQAQNVKLSPDLFRIPMIATVAGVQSPDRTKSTWRASHSDRLDWQDRLQTRIDQEQSLLKAFWDAVSDAESETLANLRDALVLAVVPTDDDLTAQAKWVGANLLIDAQADACQQTTRVGQAIETVQGLLWSLRTGLLQRDAPELTLSDDIWLNFDEEWKWLGSYASWRAAMFVFLYPENLLLPTLRDRQTPGFRAFVQRVRANRRLDPEAACQAAQAYGDYLRDVASLSPEASCHARTRLYEGTCRDRREVDRRTLFYVFATGGHTGRIFWSAYDPEAADQDFAQSFWDVVPKLENVTKLVGAQPYEISETQRYICVFAQVREEGEEKLVLVRYNLESPPWDAYSYTLDLPSGVERFDAILCRRHNNHMPPRLLIKDQHTGHIYSRTASRDACGWEEQDFRSLYLLDTNRPGVYVKEGLTDKLLTAHHLSNAQILLIYSVGFAPHVSGAEPIFVTTFTLKEFTVKNSNNNQYKQSDWLEDDGRFNCCTASNTDTKTAPSVWIGSFALKSDVVYVFWRIDTREYYRRLTKKTLPALSVSRENRLDWSLGSIISIAANAGYPPEKHDQFFVSRNILMGTFCHPFKIEKAGKVLEAPNTRIAPLMRPSFAITEFLSKDETQNRKKVIRTEWIWNKESPESNLTYLTEAYYFVPFQIALILQSQRYFDEALNWFRTIYDYTMLESGKADEREIYYGLVIEKRTEAGYKRVADWLRDPLNPHRIAATRRNTYTRSTVLSIARCLLEYADAEFTRDTAESIPRARALYATALQLLDVEEIRQELGTCGDHARRLTMNLVRKYDVPDEWLPPMAALEMSLEQSEHPGLLDEIEAELHRKLEAGPTWETFFEGAQALVAGSNEQPTSSEIRWILQDEPRARLLGQQAILAQDAAFEAARETGKIVERDLQQVTTGEGLTRPKPGIPTMKYGFCVSPNPVLFAMRLHAELSLHKLRTCRNVAGMKRTLEPYAAATDQVSGLPQIGVGGRIAFPPSSAVRPTLYRYGYLIDRAKQITAIAQQMEAALLATLEKYDAENYSQLKARQDIGLTQAQVQLQDLRVQEARDGVKLAELQRDRSAIQVERYEDWLEEGLMSKEKASLLLIASVAGGYTLASSAFGATALFGGGATAAAEALVYAAKASETWAQQLAQWASYERRAQEWEFQKTLAEQDVRIGAQQVKIAEDQVRVVGQERTIARLANEHARDTLEFLANKKFTSAELYEWMSGVLEGTYRFFLQEATAVAKLAENQLAFERAAAPAGFIQNDYWETPKASFAAALTSSTKAPERHGLTGSARLLEDIYRLDQHAVETDRRRLQLSKTFSLATLHPIEFSRFIETGVMSFETFDRNFPGHYLQLIKRVRTSVIALIPPHQGIRATLSNSGTSRVVVGGDVFQEVVVRRDPEMVALTSPRDATGVFDLQQQPETLLPFEGLGVDTTWKFRMPKSSNFFDFNSIADVLITIDYTALHSYDLEALTTGIMPENVSADRAFSFRHGLSDQWYDLHHPDLVDDPAKRMVVKWRTSNADFPPNLQDLRIQQVKLYFSGKEGAQSEFPAELTFTDAEGLKKPNGAPPESREGVISTLRGNAPTWRQALTGYEPFGEWELTLNASVQGGKSPEEAFKAGDITDILFVITYSGRLPPWPA